MSLNYHVRLQSSPWRSQTVGDEMHNLCNNKSHIWESLLVGTTLQLALIRVRVCALPHFAAVGTASHLLARTLADRSWITSTCSITQRGVSVLGHDCSVVFPLNFKAASERLFLGIHFENVGGRQSCPVVRLIGQKQLLHCLVLRNFLNTWLLILTTVICISLRPGVTYVSSPSSLSFPPGGIMYYLYSLATVEFPPQTFHVCDWFPFTPAR